MVTTSSSDSVLSDHILVDPVIAKASLVDENLDVLVVMRCWAHLICEVIFHAIDDESECSLLIAPALVLPAEVQLALSSAAGLTSKGDIEELVPVVIGGTVFMGLHLEGLLCLMDHRRSHGVVDSALHYLKVDVVATSASYSVLTNDFLAMPVVLEAMVSQVDIYFFPVVRGHFHDMLPLSVGDVQANGSLLVAPALVLPLEHQD